MDSVFFPELASGIDRLRKGQLRFAYYTTAETATQILQSREIWLRNTAVMNDFKEVWHGMECLKEAWQNSQGAKRMRDMFELLNPGSAAWAESNYNSWRQHIQSDTFITCLSEHPESENSNGRLSMWRAYGGRAGVAFVFKPDVLDTESNAIGAFAHPVSYMDDRQCGQRFSEIASRMQESLELLKTCPPEKMNGFVFSVLLWTALATKHPGFSEEREWRVAAIPSMWKSHVLKRSVEVVRGVPQHVLRLPLANRPEFQITGLEVKELLDRVIIGPCDNPGTIFRAFVSLLAEAGVANPDTKVFISGIPLRQH